MSESTARFGLPLLAAGQAAKELTHNEALSLIAFALHPAVIATGLDTPPVAPQLGEMWIVGTEPTGDWTGRASSLAGWTASGWRFLQPVEGMTVAVDSAPGSVSYRSGAWQPAQLDAARLMINGTAVVGPRGDAIALPAAGALIDEQARTAIAAILAAMQRHGLIAT